MFVITLQLNNWRQAMQHYTLKNAPLNAHYLYRSINPGRRTGAKRGIIAVYEIRCDISGGIYIGATADFLARWGKHLSDLRGKRHKNEDLQAAFTIFGEDAFTISIKQTYTTTDGLTDEEERWARRYGEDRLFNRRIGNTWVRGYTPLNSHGPGSGYKPKYRTGGITRARWFDGTAQGAAL